SRCYGGYHGSKRTVYLDQCRDLLGAVDDGSAERPESEAPPELDASCDLKCPHCESDLQLIQYERRPSWRKIFEQEIYRSDDIYSPQHHLGSGRSPPILAR
ncbi:MAG: hypothetical protein WBM40_07075, partial [Thiohalocapsa sp.]